MKTAFLAKHFLAVAAFLAILFVVEPSQYFVWHRAAHHESFVQQAAIQGSGTVANLLTEGFEIVLSPQGNVGQRLENSIRSAHKRVWVTIYILTDKPLLRALTEAAARGVDVRLLFEGNVVGQPTINRKAASALQKAGAKVAWSDASRFSYTHAKYLVVDDTWWIGTGNFSHSTFTKNREFFVTSKNSAILETLTATFLADFTHVPS